MCTHYQNSVVLIMLLFIFIRFIFIQLPKYLFVHILAVRFLNVIYSGWFSLVDSFPIQSCSVAAAHYKALQKRGTESNKVFLFDFAAGVVSRAVYRHLVSIERKGGNPDGGLQQRGKSRQLHLSHRNSELSLTWWFVFFDHVCCCSKQPGSYFMSECLTQKPSRQ